nr:hypothetical protein [uncultured Flavobacterium sp.]
MKIKTETGKQIIASNNHVFFTENETKQAIDLKAGESIKTIAATEKITSIEQSNYDGLMCNLATVKFQDSQTLNQEIGTFCANGILVGDINAQRVIKKLNLNDIDWVKKQVPHHLHADVETFFGEKEKK